MNIAVPDDELVGIVELLAFVAQLCDEQEPLVSNALTRFTGLEVYGAEELGLEATHWADFLARALGFADRSLEPAG
jgi:hypothetical protein